METPKDSGEEARTNVSHWVAQELNLCSAFIGCEGIEKTDTSVMKDDNCSSKPWSRDQDSVKTSDVTVPQRGSARRHYARVECGKSKYCTLRDSNTVAAVAPLLKRQGSYEFEKADADHFVRGKTFVFVHDDFCG